ncbi:hypothetical protein D9M71_691840 [compost metagenome]
MVWRSAARIPPPVVGLLGGLLLAPMLLGLALAPGLLDALGNELSFQMIGWLAATPGLRASRFPAPEHAAGDVIQKQHIPAVPGT